MTEHEHEHQMNDGCPQGLRERAQDLRDRGQWHFSEARRNYARARVLEAQADKDEQSPPTFNERIDRILR